MDNYFQRFPAVLRNTLEDGRVEFQVGLKRCYPEQRVYRGIRYKVPDKTGVCREDFLSQAERKIPGTDMNDIGNYSCSCFTTKEELIAAFNLPRKNKGIARGTLYDGYGPAVFETGGHIHWYLFADADPSERFEVMMDEKMG